MEEYEASTISPQLGFKALRFDVISPCQDVVRVVTVTERLQVVCSRELGIPGMAVVSWFRSPWKARNVANVDLVVYRLL